MTTKQDLGTSQRLLSNTSTPIPIYIRVHLSGMGEELPRFGGGGGGGGNDLTFLKCSFPF